MWLFPIAPQLDLDYEEAIIIEMPKNRTRNKLD
jgi:hypothetical protein